MKKTHSNMFRIIIAIFLSLGFVANSFAYDFPSGMGTVDDPWEVATAADLQGLHESGQWKFYKLSADIDMTGETWVPLTSLDHATQFQASIDGAGHVIKNLKIEATSGKVGFIMEQAGGTYVKNLGFENLVIDAPNCTPVGGIIAYTWAGNNRMFENNWVSSGTITGNSNVGALYGWCFVKENNGPNTVRNCYAGADVVVKGNQQVGGLFGRLNLVANTVTNCNFYGKVEADSSAAPITGDTWESTVKIPASLYYDADKNDMTALAALPLGAIDQSNATGLTSAEMKLSDSYVGFDFGARWVMTEKYAILNYGYVAPYSPSDTIIYPFEGMGTDSLPWLIGTAEDLAAIQTYPRDSLMWKHFKLTADIDMTGKAWKPLGNVNSWTTNNSPKFASSIDGDYHVIRNLTVNGSAPSHVEGVGFSAGFITEIRGTVKNLGFENLTVNAQGINNVGGIAGVVYGRADNPGVDRIVNCYIKGGSINGSNNVGGLVGWCNIAAQVNNNFVDADVNGVDFTGGLVGQSNAVSATFYNNAFYGTVTSESHAAPVVAKANEASSLDGANCYYTSALTSLDENNDYATALSDSELKDQSSYKGFDFSSVWKMGADYAELLFGGVSGINDKAHSIAVSVYPNPSQGVITIETEASAKVSIYEISGYTMYTANAQSGKMTVDLSSYQSGIYFVKVETAAGMDITRILVK